jgi:MFS family permease
MADVSTALPEEHRSRYRYAVLLIGFVTLAGGSGVSGCFSVFYNTLVEEFSWSRASGASPYAVNMLVSIVSAPLIGWWLDRSAPRRVFPIAALLSGGALMACSTLTTLRQFVVYYGVLSAVGQTALGAVAVIVSRWFERTRRGRAIGFADVGTGFGMVVFIPGSAWLIGTFGWRRRPSPSSALSSWRSWYRSTSGSGVPPWRQSRRSARRASGMPCVTTPSGCCA